MSTEVIQNTNRLIVKTQPILNFVDKVDINQVRRLTKVDWGKNIILECDPGLRDLLLTMSLVQEKKTGELTFDTKGRAFLGKLLLGLDEQIKEQRLINERYVLDVPLASGKNSLAYKAEDKKLGRTVVLKFFRPGRGEGIISNISRLGRVKGDPILINPLDVFQYNIDGGHGYLIPIDVMVFPFVEGVTIKEYIAKEKNSSPVLIQAFIEQSCIALRALQNDGLSHGDLHPNNVLVTTEANGQVAFRLIDVSYGADGPSDYEFPENDIEGFKFILRLALADIESGLTRISLRRHLGARIFTLVDFILNTKITSFDEIYNEIQNGAKFTQFNERKEAFLRQKFKPPRDFGILRYEELSNPNVAIKLFHPFPELFERLCAFGSAILFGHRGTGKSTYMAAMTFFPHADHPLVDYHKNFGILFSCRQGEFRKFSGRYLKITAEAKLLIKDILVTKIIRKTLSSLAVGIANERLRQPKSVRLIADLLLPRVQKTEGIMISHQMSEIESIKTTMLHAEINAIDRLYAGHPMPAQSKLLDEHSLKEFFEAVRGSFSELNQTRFSILLDDAGAPNVPKELQSLICDLMASTNNIYCVKLSAEKTTFELVTTDKKPIERVHDVRVYTISDYFCMGGGFSTARSDIETYFRELVGLRLKVCGFQSTDIRHYLGQEVMKADDIVARLVSRSRGEPMYGGWQIVWQIADRTMRHLLEMISAIFDESKTTPQKKPTVISRHTQSRQITRFSGDKLRGLMFLPGTISIKNKNHPLGKVLYEFAASFGKVSSHYLQASSGVETKAGKLRFDERLAIEIDNTLNLNADAKRVLNELIRFAVLDDEKMTTSFDDGTRKPIYIFNKVYCPILRISFRRDAHWRLSSQRFEEFLIAPTEFVRTDKRLANLLNPNEKIARPNTNELGLFD